MDGAQVQAAVELVNAACDRVAQLRRKRIGERTAKQLAEELAMVNRMMRSASDASQKGNALAQKALWFNHDHLLNELGNLDTMVQALKGMLADEQVRKEIADEGFSLDKTLRHVQTATDWIEQFRANVAQHEAILAGGLDGNTVSTRDLDMLEDRLVRYNDWEQKVAVLGKNAVVRIKQHPGYTTLPRQQPSLVKRIAAALVLSIASTVFSASGLSAQETAQQGVAKVAFENKEMNEKTIDEILNKYSTVEDVFKVIEAPVQYVTEKEAGASNFADLLAGIKDRGALIFVYKNADSNKITLRAAILAKEVAEKSRLPIIAYNGALKSCLAEFTPLIKSTGTTSLSYPSFVLAGKKDVVTGKEGVQLLDIVRGGPKDQQWYDKWKKNMTTYWVTTNITEPKNDFVWRSKNTEDAQWSKVEYQK
jgi:hypothetical protein